MRLAAKRDYAEERVVRALEECGVTVFRLSAPALPDLLCFIGRQAFLVEVKTHRSSRLTELQAPFHETAAREGWPVYIARGEDDVLRIVNAQLKVRRYE